MICLKAVFRPLTQAHALEIADEWKYEGIYSFYDMTADPEDYEGFVNADLRNKNDHYEVLENENLIGFFCVIREGASIEIGLGMRPDLCGKGKGRQFLKQILAFIERNYEFDKLIMNVASFNQRAIKVYHSCGFLDSELIKRSSNGGIYEFLTLIKKA